MTTIEDVLGGPPPRSAAEAAANRPERTEVHPSPADWRDEVLYFLLPDRFSDERTDRPPLRRHDLDAARQVPGGWTDARWQAWAESGRTRFQGGTLKGIITRLGYLSDLGITAIWIGPVWKQRREHFINDDGRPADEYHGYAIQDFLDVDPRFGSRADLVLLVSEAHEHGIRVIFDVIVNHTARNWLYEVDGVVRDLRDDPPFVENGPTYGFGPWLDGDGGRLAPDANRAADDAVWPEELQEPDVYHRRGQLGQNDFRGGFDAPGAPFRLGDMTNRDLALTGGPHDGLSVMITCWTYWMTLTDCDGFRLDTFKHTTVKEAEQFCQAVREHAEALGKRNFLLVGEVPEGDEPAGDGQSWAQKYLAVLGDALDATLEIGGTRGQMRDIAAGKADLQTTRDYLERYNRPPAPMPEDHPTPGDCFVMTIDDHDGLGTGPKRFPVMTASFDPNELTHGDVDADSYYLPRQSTPALALLLFTLGIPCLYYGLEQGMAGAARPEAPKLPFWSQGSHGGDRYLREAMFGPDHPRPLGAEGRPAAPGGATEDPEATGFGPFGSVGHHLFDPDGDDFRRARLLVEQRAARPALRLGRQYWRPTTADGVRANAEDRPVPGAVAWSRILAETEVVVLMNTNHPPRKDADPSGLVTAQVLVDGSLNPPGTARFRIAASTADIDGKAPHLAVGTELPVQENGAAFVMVAGLTPHEVVVLERVEG